MTKPYYEDDLEGDEGVETSGLGRVVWSDLLHQNMSAQQRKGVKSMGNRCYSLAKSSLFEIVQRRKIRHLSFWRPFVPLGYTGKS